MNHRWIFRAIRYFALLVTFGVCSSVIIFHWATRYSNLIANHQTLKINAQISSEPKQASEIGYSLPVSQLLDTSLLEGLSSLAEACSGNRSAKLVLLEPMLLLEELSFQYNDTHLGILQRNFADVVSLSARNFDPRTTTLALLVEGGRVDCLAKRPKNLDGWQYTRQTAIDTRLLNPDVPESQSKALKARKLPSHHFFARNGSVIHVAVLWPRGKDFFWAPAVNLSELSSELRDLFANDTFAESIAIARTYLQNLERSTIFDLIYVPSSLAHFMHYLPFARFLECNFDISWKFKRKYPMISRQMHAADAKFITTIRLFKQIIHDEYFPAWLSGGTLLGWYRQCGVIAKSGDIDLATNITNYSHDLFLHFRTQRFLKLTQQYGLPQDHLELVFNERKPGRQSQTMKLDLFFHYPDQTDYLRTNASYSEGSYIAGMASKKRQRFRARWHLPRFSGICSSSLLGLLVYVPCNALEVLQAQFGATEWFEPRLKWNWVKSPKNFEIGEKWSDSELPKVNQRF